MDNAIMGCSICNCEDVDIEHILQDRGVNTERLLRLSLSYEKPDQQQIRFELVQYLKQNYEDKHRHIITREAEIVLGLR